MAQSCTSNLHETFLPGKGVAWEAVKSCAKEHLGLGTSVATGFGKGFHEGVPGYWITSYQPVSKQMILDLINMSHAWQNRVPSISVEPSDREYKANNKEHPTKSVMRANLLATWNRVASNENSTPIEPITVEFQNPLDRHYPSQSAVSDSSRKLDPTHNEAYPSNLVISAAATRPCPLSIYVGESNLDRRNRQPDQDHRQSTGWQIGAEAFLFEGKASTRLVVTKKGRLGRGSIGEVDEVLSEGNSNYKTMARKRVLISRWRKQASSEMTILKREIKNLRSLTHPHIIEIIGCYPEEEGTQTFSFCALTYPVGDNDLAAFLYNECSYAQRSSPSFTLPSPYTEWIEKWFFCLASALAYMHSQNIHHEDIKPSNIIHRGGDVYFTDFSSSRKIEAGQDTSTASPALASRLFAAPEALASGDEMVSRHGSKTDVFSLGLVFAEMLTVLDGRGVESLRGWLHGQDGFNDRSQQYHRVAHRFDEWFTSRRSFGRYQSFVKPMLAKEREKRPSTLGVTANLRQSFFALQHCECRPHVLQNGDEDWEFIH